MTSWTYGTSKEKKEPRIPNITPSSNIQISNRVEIFQQINPEWSWRTEWIRGHDDNPLINELGIYILYKLSMFQNMQDYAVTAETDINTYVRECTPIVDGTRIYRFSKELLAFIEMCVSFSQYYLQNDPRTAGAMDTYFRDALQTYADVAYKDLHYYLARWFHACQWYSKFKPSSSAVVSAGDPELGAVTVVSVEVVDGAAPIAKRPRFSLTLNDVSAIPAAAGVALPEEGGEDPTAKERSGPRSPRS
jgi:hypothetical protein